MPMSAVQGGGCVDDGYALLEERLRSEVFQRGIRLQDLIAPFDKHRLGRVSADNFTRAIALASMALTPAEVSMLVNRFTIIHHKVPMVEYERFCEAINAVLGPRRLETDLHGEVIDGAAFNEAHKQRIAIGRRYPATITSRERDLIASSLKRIRERTIRRRLVLKPVFQDHDRFNSGNVTQQQFARCLTAIGMSFGEDIMRLLFWQYQSPSRHLLDINYTAFLADVTNEIDPGRGELSKEMNHSIRMKEQPGEHATTLPDVLYMLRAHNITSRVRLLRFLTDADPLRRNCITLTRFRSILSSIAKINLSDAQMEVLHLAFPHDKEKQQIDYRRFHNAVESALIPSGLEKHPTAELKPFVVDPIVAGLHLNEAGDDVLEDGPVLAALRTVCDWIRDHDVALVTFFRDFDRSNSGTILPVQFSSVFTTIGLQLKADVLATLLARFKRSPNGFDYRTFSAAIAQYQDIISGIASRSSMQADSQPTMAPIDLGNRTLSDGIPTPLRPNGGAVTFEKVFHKFQTYIHSRSIRIEEIITDFDPLRTGRVVPETFHRAIDMSGFKASADELQILGQAYSSSDSHSDFPNSIDWKAFVRDVSIAFSSPELEKSPLSEEEPFIPYTDESADESLQETPETTSKIDAILHRLYDTAYRFSMNPSIWFRDFDRIHRGYVNKRQFRSVLNNAGMNVTSDDVDLLFLRYHRDSNDFIGYTALCDGIDAYRRRQQAPPPVDVASLTPTNRSSSLKPKPTILAKTIERLQTVVHCRQVRLDQYFADFDVLRSGFVSPNIFRRMLDASGVKLTEIEFSLLCTEYSDREGLRFSYRRFCHDIEKVFVTRELELHPTDLSLSPLVLYDPDRQRSDLHETEAETIAINALLKELTDVVTLKGLNLKTYLEDHDRSNDGCLPISTFHSVISTWAMPLTKAQCTLLHKRFHRGDQMHYSRFVAVVEQYPRSSWKKEASIAVATKKSSTKPQMPQDPPLSLSQVMAKIKSEGAVFCLRPRSEFEPFDPFRRGHVSRSVFRRVLDTLRIHSLSPVEIEYLLNTFQDDQGRISFSRFCDAYDQTDAESLEYPTHPTETSQQLYDQTLVRLAGIAFRRKFSALENFQPFDKPFRGVISAVRMSSVLINLFEVPISEAAIHSICQLYRKGADIDYVHFCSDLQEQVNFLAAKRAAKQQQGC